MAKFQDQEFNLLKMQSSTFLGRGHTSTTSYAQNSWGGTPSPGTILPITLTLRRAIVGPNTEVLRFYGYYLFLYFVVSGSSLFSSQNLGQIFFHLLPLFRFFPPLSCFRDFAFADPMPTILLLQLYLLDSFSLFWSWMECHLLQKVFPFGLI